jgi:hypothetical protein
MAVEKEPNTTNGDRHRINIDQHDPSDRTQTPELPISSQPTTAQATTKHL